MITILGGALLIVDTYIWVVSTLKYEITGIILFNKEHRIYLLDTLGWQKDVKLVGNCLYQQYGMPIYLVHEN